MLTAHAWRWDELSEPRQLVGQLAGEAGVTIAHGELIPHDLWPAVDLPPLSWVDRLTLVAAEFDLTFQIGASGQVDLVPIPAAVALARDYPAGRDPAAVAERWRKQFPDAKVSVEGNKVRLVGLAEDQAAAGQSLRRPPVAGPRQRPGGKRIAWSSKTRRWTAC